MPNKLNLMAFICLLVLAVVGCTSPEAGHTETSKEMVSVILIGSAEHPDPVLEMVQQLEKEGILQNVIVRESFPVQIDVTGPVNIIEKLQAIPRIKPPDFK